MRDILDIELEATNGDAIGLSTAEIRGLMETEFESAQREKQPAALMRVKIERFERLAPTPERRRVVLTSLLDAMRALPRAGDLFASREGDDLVVLLPRTPPESAELIARQSIESARKLSVPGATAEQRASLCRASLCIGLAYAQTDLDLYFDTLLQVAEEGLAVASGCGGETFIHTELYGLFQRQVERVRGPRPPPVKATGTTSAKTPASAVTAPTPSRSPSAAPLLAPSTTPLQSDRSVAHNATSTASATHAPSDLVASNGVAAESLAASEAAALFTGGEPLNGIANDPVLAASIKSAFAAESRAPGTAGSTDDLESRVLALARSWAEDALAKAMKRSDARHRSEIELYERRIQKLAQALGETEDELRRIARLKSIDPGVASAYRSVQGLAREESAYATKLSLLAKILQANLDLRAKLAAAPAAS
jgi:GGDEF domain-containing protein